MRFYRQFFSDLLPHRIVLTAARVAFTPSRVIKELSQRTANSLAPPAAFVVGVTAIMLLIIQLVLKPDKSVEWVRAVGGLKQEDLEQFQKCLKTGADIDMEAELRKARWSDEASVLSDIVRETVGSLEVDSILIFVASCDKTLADKMLVQKKAMTSFDWFFLWVLPFELVATIFVFSAVLHFLVKPHSKLFSTTLSFGCYFLGTFFLFIVFTGSLSMWNPLFVVSFLGVTVLFFVTLIRGIMDLSGKNFGPACWAFNGAMLSTGVTFYALGRSIIWLVRMLMA
jgi:hypothetical protein